ncbi:DUF1801 domain-containing protein [Mucilaginibacter limnophilus]|uniref:DUF1801 domain-containing protein n=1 Tax=Mucilaginibacter limnophilus TaxID=1932778 RepID=A0A437MTG2_9SPHI|nr:DUF1801 domain-containing protein [Mucilaginibacter limnophilus]RVU00944.1 DUF1801 domain-containing protein [Mucilaginibacter limnophilus]
MAKNKTAETEVSVNDFINTVADEKKRADAFKLLKIFEEETGYPAKMWGPSIIGFGSYHYKYASGHEGDMPLAGFSPRKDAVSLYTYLAADNREEMLQRLGKHKAAKGCVYIKKTEDIYESVLREMIRMSVKTLQELYSAQ